MRKSLIVLLILILLAGGVYFYFFHLSTVKKNNPMTAVPANAALMISLDDPFEQWNILTSNAIWNYLKTNEYFSDLGQSMDSLNAEIRSQELLWDMVASRPMVISIHEIRKNEFDYLYIIDLKKASQFTFLKDYLDQLTDEDTRVLTRDYHGQELIELQFADSPTRLYMSLIDNLFVISTTHTLVEKSIDQKDEPEIIRDLDFIDVSKHMDTDQIIVFLQHHYFLDYIGQWMSPEDSESLEVLKASKYTGFSIGMNDDLLTLKGLSNVNDTLPGLLHALHRSGKGSIRVDEIAPLNTSFFMSLGFDNAQEFYTNLEQNLIDAEDGEAYKANKEKLEKFLKISIEENFLSWIDDEISLIQLHASNKTSPADFALAIRYTDQDDAKENLDFLKNQIRKKTPVKFKGISYKSHEINFLSVKGFFKLILGKAFEKIDKPYYTIMENYVVFSNSPRTLGKLIDAYMDKSVLDQSETFDKYMKNFEDESALFVYINPEQLIEDSRKFLSAKYWNNVNKNRSYFEQFPMIGMQFNAQDNLMAHQTRFHYMNEQEATDWNSLFANQIMTNDLVFAENETEESVAVEDILPEDLNDKELTENFSNGQVKYEVSLKDGQKHGTYREYDSLGNVIIKGRYKNDQKTGTWKYYDKTGELVKRERF